MVHKVPLTIIVHDPATRSRIHHGPVEERKWPDQGDPEGPNGCHRVRLAVEPGDYRAARSLLDVRGLRPYARAGPRRRRGTRFWSIRPSRTAYARTVGGIRRRLG